MIRPVLVVLHRYVGLATAIFLIVVGLTGSLLAYLQPISAWLSPELYDAPARGAALAPAELAARAQAAEPQARFAGWPLHLEEGRGVSFYAIPRSDPATGKPYALGYDTLWLDPVSGAVLGRVDTQAFPPTRHNLMRFVYRLHYALALPGRWGTWIVGIVAILWFLDCFVGAVLTFPRGRPFLSKWRPAWGVRRKRLNYDLHRAGGLWAWLLMATLALSGIYFNLGREVFLPVFDRIATRTATPFETRPPRSAAGTAPATVDAARAVEIAHRTALRLGWTVEPEGIFHSESQGFWQIYYAKSPAQWATAGTYGVFVDDASGEVIQVRAPGGTRGDVFLAWLSALHVGGVFGAPYKLLLCVLGVVIAMLSITGLVIWWRKRRHRVHHARRPQSRVPHRADFRSRRSDSLPHRSSSASS